MEPARYAYPIRYLIPPIFRIIFGVPTIAHRDAAILLRGAHPLPTVRNADNIPPTVPFILVMNHYDRPGLGTWWSVCAILCAIAERRIVEPKDVRLVMSREWWYPAGFGRSIKQPLTRWAFGRIARAYGMILVPPIIGDHELRGEGVSGIRHGLALTRGDNPSLIGVAPEGRTGENGTLCRPPRGAGLFLLMLSHRRISILPAGIYEDGQSTLIVDFGPPFQLQVPRAGDRDQQDAAAVARVMVEIGKLLPPRMWGAYAQEIEKESIMSGA